MTYATLPFGHDRSFMTRAGHTHRVRRSVVIYCAGRYFCLQWGPIAQAGRRKDFVSWNESSRANLRCAGLQQVFKGPGLMTTLIFGARSRRIHAGWLALRRGLNRRHRWLH
ncbi:hypothetical protein [Hyphomonas sp.]|uniref:hypothetical protein n=1 Tax=Hyphomonas sp. TaxID=87 RepID=UPI0025C65C47|nr:hypothetical protein [Hyphomonas sp.]